MGPVEDDGWDQVEVGAESGQWSLGLVREWLYLGWASQTRSFKNRTDEVRLSVQRFTGLIVIHRSNRRVFFFFYLKRHYFAGILRQSVSIFRCKTWVDLPTCENKPSKLQQ